MELRGLLALDSLDRPHQEDRTGGAELVGFIDFLWDSMGQKMGYQWYV